MNERRWQELFQEMLEAAGAEPGADGARENEIEKMIDMLVLSQQLQRIGQQEMPDAEQALARTRERVLASVPEETVERSFLQGFWQKWRTLRPPSLLPSLSLIPAPLAAAVAIVLVMGMMLFAAIKSSPASHLYPIRQISENFVDTLRVDNTETDNDKLAVAEGYQAVGTLTYDNQSAAVQLPGNRPVAFGPDVATIPPSHFSASAATFPQQGPKRVREKAPPPVVVLVLPPSTPSPSSPVAEIGHVFWPATPVVAGARGSVNARALALARAEIGQTDTANQSPNVTPEASPAPVVAIAISPTPVNSNVAKSEVSAESKKKQVSESKKTKKKPTPTRVVAKKKKKSTPAKVTTKKKPAPTKAKPKKKSAPTKVATKKKPTPTRAATKTKPVATAVVAKAQPSPTLVSTKSAPQPTPQATPAPNTVTPVVVVAAEPTATREISGPEVIAGSSASQGGDSLKLPTASPVVVAVMAEASATPVVEEKSGTQEQKQLRSDKKEKKSESTPTKIPATAQATPEVASLSVAAISTPASEKTKDKQPEKSKATLPATKQISQTKVVKAKATKIATPTPAKTKKVKATATPKAKQLVARGKITKIRWSNGKIKSIRVGKYWYTLTAKTVVTGRLSVGRDVQISYVVQKKNRVARKITVKSKKTKYKSVSGKIRRIYKVKGKVRAVLIGRYWYTFTSKTKVKGKVAVGKRAVVQYYPRGWGRYVVSIVVDGATRKPAKKKATATPAPSPTSVPTATPPATPTPNPDPNPTPNPNPTSTPPSQGDASAQSGD